MKNKYYMNPLTYGKLHFHSRKISKNQPQSSWTPKIFPAQKQRFALVKRLIRWKAHPVHTYSCTHTHSGHVSREISRFNGRFTRNTNDLVRSCKFHKCTAVIRKTWAVLGVLSFVHITSGGFFRVARFVNRAQVEEGFI